MRPLRPSLRPEARHEVSESSMSPLRPSMSPMRPSLKPVKPGLGPQWSCLTPLRASLKLLEPGLRPLGPGIRPQGPGLRPLEPGSRPLGPGLKSVKPSRGRCPKRRQIDPDKHPRNYHKSINFRLEGILMVHFAVSKCYTTGQGVCRLQSITCWA